MTDKRKALQEISKAASETGDPILISRAVMNNWHIISQALSAPENGISKDTATDEKSIIKDTELEEAIECTEWTLELGGDICCMEDSAGAKHMKTLIRAAKPRRKLTIEEIEKISDNSYGRWRTINALISAGIIEVSDGEG